MRGVSFGDGIAALRVENNEPGSFEHWIGDGTGHADLEEIEQPCTVRCHPSTWLHGLHTLRSITRN